MRETRRNGMLVLALALGPIAGCGEMVSVPPAHRGKILTASGFQAGYKDPSSFRLPWKGLGAAPQLVIAEISDQSFKEEMSVFVPADKLNLSFDIRGTGSISRDDGKIGAIFEAVSPKALPKQENVLVISFEDVFETYAAQVIRTRSRDIITRHSIEHVLKNLDAVGQEICDAVRKDLADTPINIVMLGLAKVQPPAVIITAQEAAKKREIEIEEAEADKLVKLKQAEAALEVAKKQQEVDLTEAETQVLVDKKLAEGVSPAFVTQRSLKIMEEIARSQNSKFMLPYEAVTNPAVHFGFIPQGLNPNAVPGIDTANKVTDSTTGKEE